MTSNMFSRFADGRSFYEQLHGRDDDLDEEEHLGFDIDEENLNQHFNDYDVDHTPGISDSRATVHSHRDTVGPSTVATPWHEDEGDNEVPASLLFEQEGQPPHTASSNYVNRNGLETLARQPIPGPSTRRARAQLDTTQAQRRLNHEETMSSTGIGTGLARAPVPVNRGPSRGSTRDKTMWKWANVSDMDRFFHDIYFYYRGGGLWCILLQRVLTIARGIFTATFLTLLTQCVEYDKIPHSQRLSQIMVPQCTRKMSTLWNMLLWMWMLYLVMIALSNVADMRRLLWLRDFYTHLLEIPESDMQTISWQDVIARFMALRDANPRVATNISTRHRRFMGAPKERVDAHDIANRLMRRENYMIAIFNKDLLDMSLPIPFMRGYQFYSQSLHFWMGLSIMDYVFSPKTGEVAQEFLRADRRGQLSQKLRERFYVYGVFSFVMAPFAFFYQICVHFFMRFNEYKSNAASIMGNRAYTRFARWRFREFNELEHIFDERLNMSYPFANRYIDQFPKKNTEHLAGTVVFMSGAVLAVLAIASTLDPEMFLAFEITHDRTVLFYMTILGSIFAAARGMVGEETKVFDPEFAMTQVIEYTHHEPDHWKSRLHSFDVKKEFSELYKPQIVIFIEELLGILLTPFILLFSFPRCSDQIIDFFREFTIHVDGVGYVCTFAEFDFKKGASNEKKAGVSRSGDVRDDYYSTKYGKMAASYYNFLDNYVVNPKTGIPGHPHRHQFHPPPAFPGLQSPTLAADMQASRMARSEHGRSRIPVPGWTPRFGPMVAPSPMASVLLDPHHQPNRIGFHGRTSHHPRTARSGYLSDNIIEEAEDGFESSSVMARQEGEEAGNLGGSVWETSPTKGLSRESSGVAAEDEGPGVIGLLAQLKQAHLDQDIGR